MDNESKTVCLALGGGGARGFVHLGVVKYLIEKKYKIKAISGTSVGAITGCFIAAGIDVDETFEIMRKRGFKNFSSLELKKDGFFSLEGLHDVISYEIQADDIAELEIPFYVCVTNISTGNAEYFNDGSIADIVTASASIPIIFKTVTINNKIYVDGGLLDNLPTKPLKNMMSQLLESASANWMKLGIEGYAELALRIFEVGISGNEKKSRKKCDILIAPENIHDYGIFDISKADELYQLGYDLASEIIK